MGRGVRLALAAALVLPACGPSDAARPNVVLMVVDTLRADHLGLYGHVRPTSPEIDAWAARGAVFEQAFATSPWTLPSFGSLYTGRLPSQHEAGVVAGEGGERRFVPLEPSARSLAQILREHGYATAAVANNPFLDPVFGVAAGFESYDHEEGDNVELRRADEVVDRALAWPGIRGGPFLLVLHFFDPHMNYDPPHPMRGRFRNGYAGPLDAPVYDLEGMRHGTAGLEPDDRRFVASVYDEEVRFVDRHVGRMLKALDARRLLDRTLVVLVADHGEEFWDHGGFEHGHSFYQELLRVPLIVWGPGVRPARIRAPVSLVDILPTLLEALALPPEPGVAGRSLWPVLTGGAPGPERALVAENAFYGSQRRALVRWPHKLVLDVETGERRLFDLEADPGERRNLVDERAERAAALADELESRFPVRDAEQVRRRARALAPETREMLRALGYVE